MNVLNKQVAAVAALTIAASGLLIAAPQARAALADCPIERVCLWRDINFTGGSFPMSNDATYPVLYNLPDWGFDNMTSSFANRHSYRDARWFSETWAGGFSRCMNSNSRESSMAWGDNDAASSVYIYTDPYAC